MATADPSVRPRDDENLSGFPNSSSNPVAVVITTYNHARFLRDAIESVLAQSCPPREVVVVDDGSSDRPEDSVADYPSVGFIRQSNQGLASARNTGMRLTSAPFILFLDADDRLRPGALHANLARLKENPAAAFSYGGYAKFYWPSGTMVAAPFCPVPSDAFSALLRVNTIGMHATVLYRRHALEIAGGFSEHLSACEDYDLYLRISKSLPVTCLDEIVAEYRQHDANMSHDDALMLSAVLKVLRLRRRDAMERGLLDDYRAGLRGWKSWYAENWLVKCRAGLNWREAVRQGARLLLLAPAETLPRLLRAFRRRARRAFKTPIAR